VSLWSKKTVFEHKSDFYRYQRNGFC
jgi:hypothetical protein